MNIYKNLYYNKTSQNYIDYKKIYSNIRFYYNQNIWQIDFTIISQQLSQHLPQMSSQHLWQMSLQHLWQMSSQHFSQHLSQHLSQMSLQHFSQQIPQQHLRQQISQNFSQSWNWQEKQIIPQQSLQQRSHLQLPPHSQQLLHFLKLQHKQSFLQQQQQGLGDRQQWQRIQLKQ